jgi:hypothetical protein
MWKVIGVCLVLLTAALPARAQDAAAIESVIAEQLEAFNARDVLSAWRHASPAIKGLFGTPQTFGRMVENGYPMVWTNRGAEFLELRVIDGRLWQKVRIRDAQGGIHILDYQMVETAQGWQINGVRILPSPEVGV